MRSIWIILALVFLILLAFFALDSETPESPVPGEPLPRVDLPTSPSPLLKPPSRFLIATRQVKGPFFEKSVVLLIQHDQSGALGLIVNRRTKTPIRDLLAEPENPPKGPRDEAESDPSGRLYVGGPVDPSQVVFLTEGPEPIAQSVQVLPGVYASSESEVLDQFYDEDISTEHFRAYVGYAGWGPGQLEREIKRGDWFESPAQIESIFDPRPELIWERLIAEHEGLQVQTTGPWQEKPALFASSRHTTPESPPLKFR
ncbi:MAG: hypothetical protein CMN75_16020 [Spirochaeta sp.]|nr:hypothetical protein [Spirochaeta sp.]RPG04493.1 MAG: YqgE/AlgH family protein [Proteobacteria bacterium TMED72]